MAVFDKDQQKIVVRVLYDGPANAGKSTNLRQLCNFFTTRRRSELYTPEELEGRTQYFDWLQVEGGLVGGVGLRCELLTVPGQRALAHRRSRLLRAADVVVFVTESTPEALEHTRPGVERLRAFLATEGLGEVPLLVQANKQDHPRAMPPEEVPAALGLPEDTVVVGARSCEGAGVRETAVLAIRAAATRIQRLVLAEGLGALPPVSETPEQLYASMHAEDVAAHGSAPVSTALAEVLAHPEAMPPEEPAPLAPAEHASTAPAPAEPSPEEPELLAPAAASEPETHFTSAEPEAPREDAAVALRALPSEERAEAAAVALAAELDSLLERLDALPFPSSMGASVVLARTALLELRNATRSTEALEVALLVAPSPEAMVVREEPANEIAPREEEAPLDEQAPPQRAQSPQEEALPAGWELVPLPTGEVPSGFLWPANVGREVLKGLLGVRPRPRADLVGSTGQADGSGTSDLLLYEVDGWCFKSSLRRRYGDADAARDALVRLARSKLALGELLCRQTVLALQPDASGSFWLWTLTPWLTTLRAEMVEANAKGDEATLGAALEAYALAALESVTLAARGGPVLDVHPSNFARGPSGLCYLDDEQHAPGAMPAFGHAILQRAEEYARWPDAMARYLGALRGAMLARVSAPAVASLGLASSLQDARAHTPAAARIKNTLLELVTSLEAASRAPADQ